MPSYDAWKARESGGDDEPPPHQWSDHEDDRECYCLRCGLGLLEFSVYRAKLCK